ncbi:MAG TPA: hypothetical protein ENG49_02755 [Candidatus Omnitrophica bacterium]|nr:hypothetical protein [Candidatus Omnitrophota bacterium]
MLTMEKKSLKGRPIGLRASMSKEEMKSHLLKIKLLWSREGFSEEEVMTAIINKCKPLGLSSSFYWNRYPDACQRLRETFEELGWEYEKNISDSMNRLRKALQNPKNEEKIRKVRKALEEDFLKQF